MNLTIRQVLLGSIPALATVLGLFWFWKRKKSPAIEWKKQQEPEKTKKQSENQLFNPKLDKTIYSEEPANEEAHEQITKDLEELIISDTVSNTFVEEASIIPKAASAQLTSHVPETEIRSSNSSSKSEVPNISTAKNCEESRFHSEIDEKVIPVKQDTSSLLCQSAEVAHVASVSQAQPTPSDWYEVCTKPENKYEREEATESTETTHDEGKTHADYPEDVVHKAEKAADTLHGNTVSDKYNTILGKDETVSEKDETPNNKDCDADVNANLECIPSKVAQVMSSMAISNDSVTEDEQPKSKDSVTVDEQPKSKDSVTVDEQPKSKDLESKGNEHKGKCVNGVVVMNGHDVPSVVDDGSGEHISEKGKAVEVSPTPAGDCDHAGSDAQSEVSSDSGRGASGIETPLATSPNELSDEGIVVYDFDIPNEACGRLIGRMGRNISQIKAQSGTEIILRRRHGRSNNFKSCSIEGTQSQVRIAIDLIKQRFPAQHWPDITYEQTNVMDETPTLTPQVMQLNLPEGVSLDVLVSSVVDANHVFLQQITHPSFPSLEKLDQCMTMVYANEEVPQLPQPIELGTICAAPMYAGWYRAMVTTTSSDTDEVDIKFMDYGGYLRIAAPLLRQIRTDFMSIPFQATECLLANVTPLTDEGGFGQEGSAVLESLVQGMLLQAQIVGRAEDGTPYVEIYSIAGPQPILVNRELVNCGVARWYEMQA